MKNIVIAIVALLLIGGGLYFFTQQVSYEQVADDSMQPNGEDGVVPQKDQIPVEPDEGIGDGAEPLEVSTDDSKTVIGQSANGNDIIAYNYGSGDTELLFIGGIHAGYSWNTVLVAYELMDYLDTPSNIPDGVKVTVIPTLNPDGQKAVIGTTGQFTAAAAPADAAQTVAGRFNGNNVDLNRNFDCQWQAEALWQNTPVSGGTKAFSEPEAAALRDYVANNKPDAVVAYYAAAGGVYASTCNGAPSSETTKLMNTYATAAGYPAYKEFNYYELTGDMVNWFAKQGVPAISVLLSDHTNLEWSKNKKGIDAVLATFAQ